MTDEQKQKMINKVIHDFDFEKVRALMLVMDWTWAGHGVPTEQKLWDKARKFNKQFDDKAKRVLSKYGLEVVEGKIVKSQRRISAEAKENGYGESEDEKVINEIINTIKGNHPTHSSKEIQKMVDWIKKQKSK